MVRSLLLTYLQDWTDNNNNNNNNKYGSTRGKCTPVLDKYVLSPGHETRSTTTATSYWSSCCCTSSHSLSKRDHPHPIVYCQQAMTTIPGPSSALSTAQKGRCCDGATVPDVSCAKAAASLVRSVSRHPVTRPSPPSTMQSTLHAVSLSLSVGPEQQPTNSPLQKL